MSGHPGNERLVGAMAAISEDEFRAISDYTTQLYCEDFPSLSGRISIEKLSSHAVEIISQWPDVADLKDGYGRWDWISIYHNRKKSKFLNFSISLDGVIEGVVSSRIEADNVAIELIQRKGGSDAMKGRITPLAVLQSAVLAYTKELDTISINQPAPFIVEYYKEKLLGYSVESVDGRVNRIITRLDNIIST